MVRLKICCHVVTQGQVSVVDAVAAWPWPCLQTWAWGHQLLWEWAAEVLWCLFFSREVPSVNSICGDWGSVRLSIHTLPKPTAKTDFREGIEAVFLATKWNQLCGAIYAPELSLRHPGICLQLLSFFPLPYPAFLTRFTQRALSL